MNASRTTLALTALALSSLGARAGEADRRWFTDENGCKAVAPEKARGVELKLTWDGACVDGFVSGKGTLKMGPVTFTGEFKQGQILSGGAMTMPGDSSFVGGFVDNAPSGRGVYKDPSATVTGVFIMEGTLVGSAVVEWSNGARYEGTLNKDKLMEGKGRLIWPNGDSYEGEFLNDLRHGTGAAVSPSGWSYTGQWAFGEQAGHGIEVYGDGGRYEGEFKAGQREGHGRHTEANGTILEGEWKADQLNGKCKFHEALGHNYEGTCVAGRSSGHGRYENATDDSVYEGEFRDGQYQGQGRLTAAGYVYEGAFALGMKSGRGKEVFDAGEQYEGEFVRNERSGQGVLRIARENGTAVTYDGMFKSGVFAGQGRLTVNEASFQGEFKKGVFIRGVVHTKQGRTIEMDSEKATYLEVLKDGTKVPVDRSALALPPAA